METLGHSSVYFNGNSRHSLLGNLRLLPYLFARPPTLVGWGGKGGEWPKSEKHFTYPSVEIGKPNQPKLCNFFGPVWAARGRGGGGGSREGGAERGGPRGGVGGGVGGRRRSLALGPGPTNAGVGDQ